MSQNIKIFVINLKNEIYRRKHIINELKKLKLKFNIFFAKKGTQLSKKELALYSETEAFKNENRDLSIDEISFALSHIKIYKKIIKSKYRLSLILEDDVVINKDLLHILKNFNKFPKNWELINFYTDAKKKIIGQKIYKNYQFVKFQERANRTCSYLIKMKTAQKLLNYALPIRFPADGLTARNDMTNVKSYGLKPDLIKIKEFPTTIKNRNSLLGKYKILSLVKKIFKYFIKL
jgi:glycosyl transferase family 25